MLTSILLALVGAAATAGGGYLVGARAGKKARDALELDVSAAERRTTELSGELAQASARASALENSLAHERNSSHTAEQLATEVRSLLNPLVGAQEAATKGLQAQMRELAERLKLWLHPKANDISIHRLEEPMAPEEAARLYELERCVECGVCVSACATKQMRETFVGAVGMMKIARFELDSRDARTAEDFYHVIGNQDGVFGCMTLLGCQDNCPKDLPHMQQIAYLRRKMAMTLV